MDIVTIFGIVFLATIAVTIAMVWMHNHKCRSCGSYHTTIHKYDSGWDTNLCGWRTNFEKICKRCGRITHWFASVD